MIKTLFVLVLSAACATAQAVGSSESQGTLTSYETFSATVPAGALTTLQSLAVDGSGESFIHLITSNPLAAVSLVTPTGQIVTAASATQLGFEFEALSQDEMSDSDWPNTSLSGAHYFITIPTGKATGTYQVRVDTAGLSASVEVIGVYFPHSRIASAAVSSHGVVSVGSAVQITGLIFEDGTPVVSNAVTGTITRIRDVPASQVTISCAPAPAKHGFRGTLFTRTNPCGGRR